MTDRERQRHIIAAALFFYRYRPIGVLERAKLDATPTIPFDPVLALQQWSAWVEASKARGLIASVDQHLAGADRVIEIMNWVQWKPEAAPAIAEAFAKLEAISDTPKKIEEGI